ncbi:palmitoleoyl-protein carboxylesterase notum1-like isoform X2 [Lineus longissimus]
MTIFYTLLLVLPFVFSTPINFKSQGDSILNLNRLSKLGDPAKVLSDLRRLAGAVHMCGGIREIPDMKLMHLTNTSVTCNDGSPAGYYIRKSYGSTKWIIFLEGGWYCFDKPSCRGRWTNMRKLMSSKEWPPARRGTGILSSHPEENPLHFYENMILVPYCSSDSWSGTFTAKSDEEFSFHGTYIVEEVIKDIVADGHLDNAKRVLVAGSSAGATGVLLNLDKISTTLSELAPRVKVRGLADSGWFLDNDPFRPIACTDAHLCAPKEGIKRGKKLWNGVVPESCRTGVPAGEEWRCYFGHVIYKTMQTPVFIIQNMFDEAQITADNVGPPTSQSQWQYIHRVGQSLKNTLENVSAVFAPACLSHIFLTKSDWQNIVINDISLPQALRCWEQGKHETNHYKDSELDWRRWGGQMESRNRIVRFQGDEPRSGSHSRRSKNRRRKKSRKRDKKNKGKSNKRLKRSLFDQHSQHHWDHHNNRCKHHLIDRCAWPQCNLSCPKIRNPFTGEEMDFIDLLMQFGLDMSSIANALGMNLGTLQTMDHDILLQLLIQQE